jgi:hypothetical protein
VSTKWRRAKAGQAHTWGQCDDRWPMARGKRRCRQCARHMGATTRELGRWADRRKLPVGTGPSREKEIEKRRKGLGRGKKRAVGLLGKRILAQDGLA